MLLAHGSGDLTTLFGVMGYLLLVFTPGAWITFGLALDRIPFWARLLTGAMLSPLVVCAEFYLLRLMGAPFGATAVILVLVNLPAIYLVWKRRGKLASVKRSDWLIGAAAIVIPVACIMSLLLTTDARIYSAHAWLHADPVYMFARGQLILEDPTLAGVKLVYPVWSALVFQAVCSFLVNSPPVASYVWGNLLCLICIYGFAAGITSEMGGGKLAQLSSGIWLLFGTNPVGYIVMKLAPGGASHQLWGDSRYTPWVSKFQLFSPMSLALGMTIAIIYLLLQSGSLTKQLLVVVCLLLSGIGLFYPLLLPPACGIIGAKMLALLAEKQNGRWTFPRKEWLALASILLLGVLLTYGELKFLASDKPATASLVHFSTITSAARKIVESLIATSLLVTGLAFTFRDRWKSRRSATVFLLAGALGSYTLYAVFHILYYENEYKFVFLAAMCLAVFPALAAERIWREWPRTKAAPVLAGTVLLLFTTYAHWSYVTWPYLGLLPGHQSKPYDAPVDASSFYLQLDRREPWSGVCTAVRRLTPPDSVLVLKNGAFYFPGLTARSLYVSPLGGAAYAGVNQDADLLDAVIRGTGQQILEQRRATLGDLFGAGDPIRREQALNTILALQRPVAIVADAEHSDLPEWLKQKTAVELYAENGLSLWLIDKRGGVRR
ncbi:MAG TPA: hypothetical protein VN948_06650 [Terriglobales bacterium]|nr:hypothetical protein [Terriglobales bacterium]